MMTRQKLTAILKKGGVQPAKYRSMDGYRIRVDGYRGRVYGFSLTAHTGTALHGMDSYEARIKVVRDEIVNALNGAGIRFEDKGDELYVAAEQSTD